MFPSVLILAKSRLATCESRENTRSLLVVAHESWILLSILFYSGQADGIVIVKTTQAVLVAEYAHPTQPGEATKITEVRHLGSFASNRPRRRRR